ncbi:reverse transcriptase domain-containing protein [Tanacetum coccineum]
MPSPSNLKQMQQLSGKLAALNKFLSKAAKKALPCLDTLKKCTNKKVFHWTGEAEEAFQEMKRLITELPTLTAPMKEEELMVYLSAANKVVIAVLLVERHGRQAPIHYVSRILQGAEINYLPMEKLVLALELNERSVDTVDVNAIIEESTRTWMTPIQEYIEAAENPTIRWPPKHDDSEKHATTPWRNESYTKNHT